MDDSEYSEWFVAKQGLRQGCMLLALSLISFHPAVNTAALQFFSAAAYILANLMHHDEGVPQGEGGGGKRRRR